MNGARCGRTDTSSTMRAQPLEACASVGADGIGAGDLTDNRELAAGDADDIHRLHSLMVAGAQSLLALRGLPLQTLERLAHLVGIGRTRLLHRRLVGVDQAVG